MYVIIDDVDNEPIAIVNTLDEALPRIREYINYNADFDVNMKVSEFSVRKISDRTKKIEYNEKEN